MNSDFNSGYHRTTPLLALLQTACDRRLKAVCVATHGKYAGSRIKELNTVRLKMERDGKSFSEIKDLFAATIEVNNTPAIPGVLKELEKYFEVTDAPARKKKPQEFIYDDKHLLLKLRPEELGSEDLTNPELLKIEFELQIKTAMQAAWSAITRDSYKTKRLSSERARLDSAIRAQIEIADILLSQLIKIQAEEDTELTDEFKDFAELNKIIALIENVMPHHMPDDRGRMARTINGYLEMCDPDTDLLFLEAILNKPEYKKYLDYSSLSASEKVFLLLVMEDRLKEPFIKPSEGHSRRFLITEDMLSLCPKLRESLPERRVNLEPLI